MGSGGCTSNEVSYNIPLDRGAGRREMGSGIQEE